MYIVGPTVQYVPDILPSTFCSTQPLARYDDSYSSLYSSTSRVKVWEVRRYQDLYTTFILYKPSFVQKYCMLSLFRFLVHAHYTPTVSYRCHHRRIATRCDRAPSAASHVHACVCGPSRIPASPRNCSSATTYDAPACGVACTAGFSRAPTGRV